MRKEIPHPAGMPVVRTAVSPKVVISTASERRGVGRVADSRRLDAALAGRGPAPQRTRR